MKVLAAALAILALSGLSGAKAAPFPARGKFVYSDFCYGPQPWAVRGHRVELLHGPNGDYVTVEFSDGGFDSGPVHATPVRLNGADGTLWFSYQDYNDDYQFEGSVTPSALTGIFDDDNTVHTIGRVPNSWPEMPPCRPASPATPPK